MEKDKKRFVSQLKTAFQDRESVQKTELRDLFTQVFPGSGENAFRRMLYYLEKNHIIQPLGAGMYALLFSAAASSKNRFIPELSDGVRELYRSVHEAFPHTVFLIWETSELFEFMLHQPARKQILVEVEKDASESFFNHIKSCPDRSVFYKPNRTIMDRYVLDTAESVLVLNLITQAPTISIDGIVSAGLEKILVDLFADRERYYMFQGEELSHIYRTVFSEYWVNTRTMFRYAGRRNITEKLKKFIQTQVEIKI